MQKLLSDFAVSESGKVKCVTISGAIRRRLYDMGITPDALITLRKVAPLGDPIEVTVRGYELSLRRAEAQQVLMEVQEV